MRDRTCATGLCERSCFNKTGNQGWEQPCSHDPGLSLRTELKFTKKWASPQSFHSPFGNNLHKMITGLSRSPEHHYCAPAFCSNSLFSHKRPHWKAWRRNPFMLRPSKVCPGPRAVSVNFFPERHPTSSQFSKPVLACEQFRPSALIHRSLRRVGVIY